MLENEFRRLEEYVQNHIKKETKVFSLFLSFLLFVVSCCESELKNMCKSTLRRRRRFFFSFLLFVVSCCESESGVVVVFVIAVADDMARNR